ncbi:MAG TPA: chemotaxis protein CheW [Leptospiraceae bacterium]|nr:chemotaxis protein CheW [Leptospiraceae bacterium]HMZ57481.1 chemotaxis protein CheW [Leptospiraceae bacterium]HNF14767.1 chemotaxis protein CheW [Leptospiraceae bacterium]HNF24143.1 chemotaxis protein CheW [Leptospiraceae bacterium]HNH06888.1 chemotaxis protein CheW [Leptospiraceae bacterium]
MEKLYCTFYLDQLYYGISISTIQEIIQNQPILPIPLASENVDGLINLRGHIISVLNLNRILSGTESESELRTLLIIYTSAGLVGLRIDDVHEIISLSEEKKEPPPATLHGNLKAFISHTYKLPESFLLILDAESVAAVQ